MREQLLAEIGEHEAVIASLRDLAPAFEGVTEALAGCLGRGGKVLLCGNGGSAADAQHLAAELVGRFRQHRAPLAAVALTTDSSILTSVANDYDYASVFSRQVEALGRRGDALIGISTSGRSPNVVAALSVARGLGLVTVGLLGGDGGPAAALCDHALRVACRDTARIQEAHILIGHALCGALETRFAGLPEVAR